MSKDRSRIEQFLYTYKRYADQRGIIFLRLWYQPINEFLFSNSDGLSLNQESTSLSTTEMPTTTTNPSPKSTYRPGGILKIIKENSHAYELFSNLMDKMSFISFFH